MFDHPIVTGAQLLRAIPGAAERTLRAAPCIASTSRVNVVFNGERAACAIERTGKSGRVTKRNPTPDTVYDVRGHIILPAVDATARMPRSLANEWLAYSLHEVFHGIYTDKHSYDAMLRDVLLAFKARAPSLDMPGLHSIWNAIEDPRIECAAVRHGIARGFVNVARGLVLKHWTEGRATRELARDHAARGNVRQAFEILPGSVCYVGRLWLPAEDRAAMRAELPPCILPHVDAACAALAALEVRTLPEATGDAAQARDVRPLLVAILEAMLAQRAATPGEQGAKGAGKAANGPPSDEGGAGDAGQPGDEGDAPEGDEGGAEASGEGDEGGDAGTGATGQPGQGGAAQGDAPQPEGGEATGSENAPGGSNQTGAAADAPAKPLDLSGAGQEGKRMQPGDAMRPVITVETLKQVGSDNPLSGYSHPKPAKVDEALPAEVESEQARARAAVANPGAIAYQLRRILSRTDTSEHRRGLSHGRLRVQALPRALATGAGAFQRRMDAGSDRCSVMVAVDISSSMNQWDGNVRKGHENLSRGAHAGAFAMLLLDALRGAHGSTSYVFGFGGSAGRDEFDQCTFRPALIKGWDDSYATAAKRAARLRTLPHGGTPIRPALAYAVRELRNAPQGRKVLIVLTDADFDGRNERPIIEAAERDGVLCIGVGVGADAMQIGNICPRHNIAVQDVSQLSEKVCRTLADAVLSQGLNRPA